MASLHPLVAGVLLGALTAVLVRLAPAAWRLRLLAVLLGVAAGIYAGGALGSGAGRLQLQVQFGGAVVYALMAVAGSNAPRALGLAWLAHALWDAATHAALIGIHLPAWYGPACLGYDVVVGGALLAWPAAFRAARG